MRSYRIVLAAFAITMGLSAAVDAQVLFFSRSSFFEHSCIRETDGADSHVCKILSDLAADSGGTMDCSKLTSSHLFCSSSFPCIHLMSRHGMGPLMEAPKWLFVSMLQYPYQHSVNLVTALLCRRVPMPLGCWHVIHLLPCALAGLAWISGS